MMPLTVRKFQQAAAQRDASTNTESAKAAPRETWPEADREAYATATATAGRVLDRLIAGVALLVLLPLFLAVAIAIRHESPGPAIFRQRRSGVHGVPFVVFKFRTMRVMEDGPEIRQATLGDNRVTPLGRILRKTSIDELPQLINVLLGDMSIVGPRPHALAHDRYYGALIAEYHKRFRVLPGITGWAQISGSRGETPTLEDMRIRVMLDVWYTEHKSLRLDVMIILKTIWMEIMRASNAY